MSDNTCYTVRAILHNRCALRFLLVLWCALGTKSLGTTDLENSNSTYHGCHWGTSGSFHSVRKVPKLNGLFDRNRVVPIRIYSTQSENLFYNPVYSGFSAETHLLASPSSISSTLCSITKLLCLFAACLLQILKIHPLFLGYAFYFVSFGCIFHISGPPPSILMIDISF